MNIFKKVIPLFNLLANLFFLIAAFSYLVINKSGHTSFDPYILLIIFIPSILISSYYIFSSDKFISVIAILSIATGLTGIILLMYLDFTNSLLQYDIWIKRGMPGRGELNVIFAR